MRLRPVVPFALASISCLWPPAVRGETPYAIAGPALAAPTRAILPLTAEEKAAGALDARWTRLQADALALGIAPGPVPPARVLDPLSSPWPLAALDPAAASLRLAESHPSLTGAAAEDLEVVSVRPTSRITFVHLRQRVRGLPVLGTKVTLGWDGVGRLRLAGAGVFLPPPGAAPAGPGPPASPASPGSPGSLDEPEAWIPVEQARTSALGGFPDDVRLVRWEEAERAWLPVRAESADRAGAPHFLPVWRLRLRTEDPGGWWEACVHGGTAELLSRRSLVLDLDGGTDPGSRLAGRAGGWIEPTTAGDPQEERPFAHLSVQLRDSLLTIPGEADAQGSFLLDAPAPGAYRLRAYIAGKYIRIAMGTRAAPTPFQDWRVDVPGAVSIVWADPVSAAARDAYFHANRAHDVVRARDDGPALAPLDRPVDLVIDAPISPLSRCNAWWDGEALGFHAASTWCPSLARIASVVYHEYGHAAMQYVTNPSTPPDYLNEGMSDYFAAAIQDDPRIGLGFMGPNTMMRELETDRVWPDDASWDPHAQGLIIASTLWDLRRALGSDLTDSLAHFACYGAAQTHEEFLLDLLAWDDDDGEIENGTPHFDEIIGVFEAHGIGDKGIYLACDPLSDPIEGPADVEARVTIRSPLYAVQADSSALFVRAEGEAAFRRLSLARLERTPTYAGRIPLPSPETRVEYYWRGVNAAGRSASLPSDAPASTFSFRVRRDTKAPVLAHAPASVAAAGVDGHWIRARVGDDSGRLESVSARFALGPDGEEREVPLRPIAPDLYTAELPTGLLEAGREIRYVLHARDRAAQPNAALLPDTGSFRIAVREGAGFDLESDPGPIEASGDWQWGTPDEPALVHSGTRCWGTGLAAGPADAGISDLVWGPIDLRTTERASLLLRHFYDAESERAGGSVEVSSSPAPDWSPLTPDGGYPAANGAGSSGVFRGRSDDYEEALFALDRVLGRKIWIRFRFESDGAGRGWFVDDLRWVRAQARVRPASFEAVSGQDGRVTLRWSPPPGVEVASPRFRGYRLYRTPSRGQIDGEPLSDLPPGDLSLVDRGLQNGIAYRYRLHALYDEGESAACERTATPNPGRLTLEVPEVDLALRDFAPRDTTLPLRNSGRGELLYQVFVGGAAAALSDVKAVYRVRQADETDAIPVTPDPDDPIAAPDLAEIRARQWIDAGARMLAIELSGHGNWGDPALEWGGLVLIDTDDDLTTGVDGIGPGWETQGSIGAEWSVAFGRLARDLGGQGAQALLRRAGDPPPGTPLDSVELHAAPDRLVFSLPLAQIGDPAQIQIAVLAGRGLSEPAVDRAPDRPVVWMRPHPLRDLLLAGARGEVAMEIDGTGLRNGSYAGCLVLESSDREEPWKRLPVRLRVDRGFPPDLAGLAFRSLRSGIEGRFRLRPEIRPDSVFAEKRAGADWMPLPPGLSEPGADGRHVFLDRGAPAEGLSFYRVRVVEGARAHLYGPYAAEWDFRPPPIDAPALASTAEGIEGLFLLSPALGDVRAVRVARREATGGDWAAVHSAAPDSSRRVGFVDRWSALRRDGIRPGGAYVYRLQVDTAAEDSLSYGPYAASFEPPIPAELALHPPRPTPFREETLLRLDLPRDAPVRLEVFAIDGRRRAVLLERALPAGVHQIVWNGRDAAGNRLPAGVYWLRAATPAGAKTTRALRLE